MKKALITGINGQDGSYLAEFLLDKGYEVHGILKRNSVAENQTARLDAVFKQLHLYYGDLTDLSSLISIMQNVMPDELYNLAAQSHVRISFDVPIYTVQTDAVGVLNVFEACKLIKPDCKILVLTVVRRSSHITLQEIIAIHTTCLSVMASSLITNLLGEGRTSLQARL